jgi:crotonobetainyl-CoA:carnitine CoA-transferase CaiB-like acyl-CoA transferase
MIQYFVPTVRYSSKSSIPRKGSTLTSPKLTTTGLLNTVTVLEIGSSDTLHVAGMLLADQGATVIRIERAKYTSPTPEYHRITDRSKRVVRYDPDATGDQTALRKLIAGADVLIDDLDEKLAPWVHPDSELLDSVNRCTIVPSLRKDRPEQWNDTTAAAMAGVYEDGLSIGAPPRYNGVEIASTLGALYTINAVARLLLGYRRSGTIDTVRIPLDRILLFGQSLTIMIRSKPPVCWEPFRMIASPFMCAWEAAKGTFVYVHVGMPRHLRSFLFFLDKIGFSSEKQRIKKALHPATRRDPMTLQSVREGKEITAVFQQLFLKKTADEWEELLSNAGFCCTKIRSFDEWLHHPQVRQPRQVIESTTTDGTSLTLPGALFVSARHPDAAIAPPITNPDQAAGLVRQQETPPVQTDNSLPLKGLRVMDLGRVIAGPFCGRLLAEAGAEVLQVSLRNNHLNWEEPFGIIYNAGKSSVTLDYNNPEGKEAFRKLFEWFKPDVVVHNFMDDAAKKIGCDYNSCKALKDDVIVVDFTAYTRGGPWENFTGMEQNVQAASGIIATFAGSSAPRILPIPPNDLSAGLIGSFGALLSLLDREKSGKGNRITSYICFPSILMHMHSLNQKTVDERKGTLNRYFKTSDGYILLSARHDRLAQLAPILGNPPAINEKILGQQFKKHPTAWWIEHIGNVDNDGSIVVIARKSLSRLLKSELSGTEALFSSSFHEGFGRVVYSQPPLSSRHSQMSTISPAPYPGSSTAAILNKLGIDPKRHAPVIPPAADKPVSLKARIWWIFRQAKWLSVILYRNRFMKGFGER